VAPRDLKRGHKSWRRNTVRWIRYGLPGFLALGLLMAVILGHLAGRRKLAEERDFERAIEPPSRVVSTLAGPVLELTLSEQRMNGITTVRLRPAVRPLEISGYGIVLRPAEIAAQVAKLVEARSTAHSSLAELTAARSEYNRLLRLRRAGVQVALKEVEKARALWLADSARTVSSVMALRAERQRMREKLGPRLTQWVETGNVRMRKYLDGTRLIVRATVTATAPVVRNGAGAWVTMIRGKPVAARVVSTLPATDPRIQGRSLLLEISSGLQQLLPGMRVTVRISTGQSRQGVMVPDSAVVWLAGRPWVYVRRDSTHFERRTLRDSQRVAGGWFVSEDLSSGEEIVVHGAQLLLSEELRSQIQVGEEGEQR